MKEKLIKRGAEAEIYLSKWLDRDVIVKKRITKRYRNKELDRTLRAKRIKTEAKLISDVRALGISTPIIYDIDSMECKLTMEHVDGIRVKEILPKLSEKERKKLCNRIGRDIGVLHSNGIIHGDLTTSNMIVTGETGNSRNLPKICKLHAPKGAYVLRNSKEFRTFVRNSQANCVDYEFGQSAHIAAQIRKLPKDYKIYFIDLSMGEKNNEIEAKGTDLHVLKEAFESTHSELDCFKYVLDGYKKEYEKANDVIMKIDEITKRGRYTN